MRGQRIRYVRVSTLDQNEKRQLEGQVLAPWSASRPNTMLSQLIYVAT